MSLLDEPLQCAARGGWKLIAEEFIEPRGRQGFLYDKTFGARKHANQFAAGSRALSFRQLIRKISATPVQMAESATLNAGKSSGVLPAASLQVKMQKSTTAWRPRQQTIREVANDTAENQAERELAGERARMEMMPCQEQGDERTECYHGERGIVAGEQAPCRAGIGAMGEVEKSGMMMISSPS